MNSLTDTQKKRILTLLEKISKDVALIHRKEAKEKESKKILKDNAELLNHYRRFVSPRKILGKFIDKAKNKFYYETEYFIGEIVARQERLMKKL
jgi:hypothetical protein